MEIILLERVEKLGQMGDAGISNEAELRQMRAQGIGEHGTLAHEQRPGTMCHEHALLFDRLGRNEPHRRALHGFADGLGIQHIALAALDVALHVGRGNEANFVPHGDECSSPVVRCSAGLNADQARRQLREEGQHLAEWRAGLRGDSHAALLLDML